MDRSYSRNVCRVLDADDLEQCNKRLRSEWLGNRPSGYRQLTDRVDGTLLRREMDRAGHSTLGTEAESKVGTGEPNTDSASS